jgi:hypothetical protein
VWTTQIMRTMTKKRMKLTNDFIFDIYCNQSDIFMCYICEDLILGLKYFLCMSFESKL